MTQMKHFRVAMWSELWSELWSEVSIPSNQFPSTYERMFFMQYMSVKEVAAQWGVTIQMVRRYCQKGMALK